MILDSNIIIYASLPDFKSLREFLRLRENEIVIATITKIEVLCYHKLTNSEKLFFENFFNSTTIISLNQSIAIFTNNENDFIGIENLEVISMKTII